MSSELAQTSGEISWRWQTEHGLRNRRTCRVHAAILQTPSSATTATTIIFSASSLASRAARYWTRGGTLRNVPRGRRHTEELLPQAPPHHLRTASRSTRQPDLDGGFRVSQASGRAGLGLDLDCPWSKSQAEGPAGENEKRQLSGGEIEGGGGGGVGGDDDCFGWPDLAYFSTRDQS
ncbi:hypothetical protein HAX54_036514 [Datura stramonium]|uniref:Uncharacterized protein n=1 Tax=Datura stramonium TaxID=4076 RepID=A0ABS8VHU9_DATST|nr:hypothetical protein [Datura stramonium]